MMSFSGLLDKIILEHLTELQKPGVISIRPGYQAVGGWLTKKPAIVVTVDKKRDEVAPQDRLPETIDGFAVDVREAGPLLRLRAKNPNLYAQVAAHARPELALPYFPNERDPEGRLLSPDQEDVEAALKPTKPKINYSAPANAPLELVEDTFTITCHVSPDSGWLQLMPFLTGTSAVLTVGMYDFTSAHILETLTAALQPTKKLNMVLDHPSPDRTLDQSDEQTHDALASSLASNLAFAWALENKDPKAAAWIYPSAYHIKVAVRDEAAFWLSSGNWNNSNQPDIDPFTDPSAAEPMVKSSDRDWHIIVQHKGLAQLFEKYLRNDLEVASAHQAQSAPSSMPMDVLGELAEPDQPVTSAVPRQYFSPKTITAKMQIQPVLTPDNYSQIVLSLLNSAKKTLYLQIPYITPTDKPDSLVLNGLIEAIARKIRAGLDVRLILSHYEKMGALEQLQSAGIDATNVHIQNNLHNKGMIVDSVVVAVGSQNWSPPGVTTNRDATLIIYNREAAEYWEAIFLHDWVNMSKQYASDSV
jgi:PLD-like domain